MNQRLRPIFVFLVLMFATPAFSAKEFRGFVRGQRSLSFFGGQPLFFRYDKFISWKKAWSIDGGYHADGYPYGATNFSIYYYNVKDHVKGKSFFNSLIFYGGPGFFVGYKSNDEESNKKLKIGFRGYVGTEYLFANTSFSIKTELGPAFFLAGDKFLGFQGMIGVTYYFDGYSKLKKQKLRRSF